MEDRTLLSTFLVNTTADSGPGSLRQAIVDSNAATSGTNRIDFGIPGQGWQAISPLSPLPAITHAVLIDGFSQPGYAGTPLIEINGSKAGGGDGLTITGPNVTVRGLDVNSFSQGAGIHITGTAATGNWIYGNYLGADPTGTQADPNNYGVQIDGGAGRNLVGTNGDGVNDTAERNLLSGNLFAGLGIAGQATDGNVVAGNFIGTDLTGTQALANGGGIFSGQSVKDSKGNVIGGGVVIDGGASANRIGTDGQSADGVGERNLISGNAWDGMDLVDSGTSQNIVAGNLIGTDVTGKNSLANRDGLFLDGAATANRIGINPHGGNADASEGNIIAGNGYEGVQIWNGSDGNVVAGNEIGTDDTGFASLPNQVGGIDIELGSNNNTIGGTVSGAGNLITNNGGPGVDVTDTSVGNQITGNRIFANSGQAIDLGLDGVTYNAPSRRHGPNNFQNFPVIVTTADGQLEGWLGGSTPDAPFHLEFFASAAYGPGGAGEAEDYLGSLEVTTDIRGQVVFNVPFAPPADLPIITATATDPQGNTSEVSAPRRVALQAPTQSVRLVPGTSFVFSAALGDAITLGDPDAGPLDPTWSLTLSVEAGTLTLSGIAGLTGSGDGTGTLQYQGHVSALNAALEGLRFTPPTGSHVLTTLSLDAQPNGVSPVAAQVVISDGVFLVTTTADSGPGSLRQAILDSNTATGGPNTIDFAIPGPGVQTIALASPLPALSTSILLDGFSQPGYAGSPLIELSGQSDAGPDGLTIAGASVTVRGVAITGFALGTGSQTDVLILPSILLQPNPSSSAGQVDSYRIDTANEGIFVAQVHPQGLTTRLSLLDSQGRVLVQSESLSPTDPDNVIDQYLSAGTYYLQVTSAGGAGRYTLSSSILPKSAPFQPLTTPSRSGLIAAGDFSSNGILDIATPDGIYMGVGDGTLRNPTAGLGLPDAAGIYSAIATGDFRGDGKLDLVLADSNNNTVDVLLGNGDGTFQPAVEYGVGQSPDSLVVGDFNGDGHLDLAVANLYSNDISVFLGNGDGTFQTPEQIAAGFHPASLVAGDFNGDGHLDLAEIEGLFAAPAVLLGNGDGTFQAPRQVAAFETLPTALVAGDFNGDGKLDLAVAYFGDLPYGTDPGGVSVLLGNGDGTFQPARRFAAESELNSLVAGDFNGDGRLDLAVGSSVTSGGQVLLGNGDGTFQAPEPYSTGVDSVVSLISGDFKRDGRLDLVAASNNSFSILLGNGDGTFQTPEQNSTGALATSVVAGDFNGDGRLDLATANHFSNDVSVLLGNGDGTFQTAREYSAGLSPSAVVAGDFNGDGRLDLAVANTNSNDISILLGNGDGTFQSAKEYPAGDHPWSLVTGDFNGDGKLDLAVVDAGDFVYGTGDPGGVSILLGNGDGTFQPAREYAAGLDGLGPTTLVGLAAGDFTSNGELDLFVATRDGVFLLLGNGDGTFQTTKEFAVGAYPGTVVPGDFNGDGKLDVAVATGSGVQVLLGNGDGTFRMGPLVAGDKSNPYPLVAGDLTGNGRLDLATAGAVLLGNGNGTFQPPKPFVVGNSPFSVVAGDFNGSGKLGLATANGFSNNVSVLLGNGDGTLSDAGQFDTTPHAKPLVADVNRDGTEDVLVVDGAGNILYRHGIPGQPGAFEPPVTVNPGFPSRDIAWVPDTRDGPVLASVDAHDDAVSLYAWREGGFVRVGSLATGRLPAQIIAADLNGNGWDDLVVRNAGDGTLTVFFNNGLGSFWTGFLPFSPVTLPVGLGASDLQAIDTAGDGYLDLVVTNKLTGQVSILRNLGNRSFAPPTPYRAGTGLSEIDSSSSPEVTSLEATGGVAGGPLTPGGSTSLVTINPGSNTLDVLAGLGGGRFANPTTIQTEQPGTVVRMADFTGNGIDDLAVLSADGLSIYLGNGKGGFLPPTTYAVPSEADGLTVADLLGNGKLDLLVGDAYGDVLVLMGNGDGTFSPYHEANQAVELAVADLTGNGSKDIIYADQGLDRVVVDYGAGNSTVLANQSTGLLEPGAVALADLNGDGIPDLIVANSGSNNVLIYPGLGNGQFGPAVNGGHGYFVGDNPVGITVADLTGGLPDLVVADKGSNQVSILLNQSQKAGPITFSAGPRLNAGGSGPVSTVVGNFTGGAFPDLLVTNSGSNDVTLLPGVGLGFFNDQNPRIYSVGSDPVTSFVGNFNGQPDLVTVNAGSNDLTLISGFEGASPIVTTIASGGVDPTTAFAFAAGSGFEDLVVGNGGNGVLALFEGGTDGLSLTSTTSEPDLPSPTALVFAGLAGGEVQFYAATEGREAAALVALSLGGQIAPGPVLTPSPTVAVAQLVPLQESSLALAGTLLIVTLESPAGDVHPGTVGTVEIGAEAEAAPPVSSAVPLAASQAALSVSSAVPLAAGQGAVAAQGLGDDAGRGDEPAAEPGGPAAGVPAATTGPSWQRLILGTEEALERFNRQHPELFPSGRDDGRETSPTGGQGQGPTPTQPVRPPGPSSSSRAGRRLEAIDRAIELRDDAEVAALERSGGGERPAPVPWRWRYAAPDPEPQRMIPHRPHRPGTAGVPAQQVQEPGPFPTVPDAERRSEVAASLALVASVAGAIGVHADDRRTGKRTFLTGRRGWQVPAWRGRDTRAKGG
jgi:hypothetical protein